MRWPRLLTAFTKPHGADAPSDAGDLCQISLDAMRIGQCGVICDLQLAESDDKRLRTLGICPGRRVWMVRRGDPMVLRVMGSRMGLARELARQVTVEVCAPPCTVAADLKPGLAAQEAGQ